MLTQLAGFVWPLDHAQVVLSFRAKSRNIFQPNESQRSWCLFSRAVSDFFEDVMSTKTKFLRLILALGFVTPVCGKAFTNLNFESAQVVPNDPIFGFLDWNLAVPGWSHSSGSDTQIVYYRQEHLGGTQYYMLYDSMSPIYAPGTQLAGNYSVGFASGYAASGPDPQPWVQAYLAQTGLIAANVHSIRFLATGSFALFVGGVQIPTLSLGGYAYAGDVSAFAGTTTEFKIVNTTTQLHNPVVVDNIVFSSAPVPEPTTFILMFGGLAAISIFRRKRARKG
jgi:hypothetical protein